MLSNIIGSFIAVLIGGQLVYYAYSLPSFLLRLGLNTVGITKQKKSLFMH